MKPNEEQDYKLAGDETVLNYCIDGKIRGRSEAVSYLIDTYNYSMIRAYGYLNQLETKLKLGTCQIGLRRLKRGESFFAFEIENESELDENDVVVLVHADDMMKKSMNGTCSVLNKQPINVLRGDNMDNMDSMENIVENIHLALENFHHGDWGKEFTRNFIDEKINEMNDMVNKTLDDKEKK